MKFDRTNAVHLGILIARKLGDLQEQGVALGVCEIVLGSETDKILAHAKESGHHFEFAAAPPAGRGPGRGILHGGKWDGIPVVVDSATPHLATARLRRQHKPALD